MKALVVDDAPDSRIFVRALLERWGYETLEASDGDEALEVTKSTETRIVVCDWVMPAMSGPEFCRALRETHLGRYVYVILLTGRSERADLVAGLNAGADDFLSKPLDAQVLRARLRVAERILGLEQRLEEQQQQLRCAYDQIQSDLAAAALVQRQLLPSTDRTLSPLRADWLYVPAAQLSGDSFNFFEITPDLIGFYQLDVSGHGIPAALLSASLSRTLMPNGGPGVVAKEHFLEPARFVEAMNLRLTDHEDELENFATLVYGTLNRRTGDGEIAVAGHPPPIVQRRTGPVEFLTTGGMPVGIFPDTGYASQRFHLGSGDRLVIYSDGVTDCRNAVGDTFGEERLTAVVEASRAMKNDVLSKAVAERLREWRDDSDPDDDISVLVLTRPREEDAVRENSPTSGEKR